MRWLRALRERIRTVFHRSRAEEELDDELRFHLEMETERSLQNGVSPSEARRSALTHFGGMEQVKELVRDEYGLRLLEDVARDIRFALRSLMNNRRFTILSALTLALGIGASAAVFSVVYGVMLKPLPFPDSDRLVVVWERNLSLQIPFMHADRPDLAAWQQQNSVFEGLGAFSPKTVFLKGPEEVERLQGIRVTAALFPLLRAQPRLGRNFTDEEDRPGHGRVVIVSHGFWKTRLGSDARAIGTTVILNDETFTVIGVMPQGFEFPPRLSEDDSGLERAELWMPLAMNMQEGRGAHFLMVIGRLRAGVRLENAQAEMAVISQRLQKQFPASNAGWDVYLVPLDRQLFGEIGPQLWTLLGAVSCLLLIACVNVTNLTLARASTRGKEFAIRSGLGAGRRRLIRQLLVEGLCLALPAGALGLLLAYSGTRVLVQLAPHGIFRMDQVALDIWVLAFTFGVSALTGIAFGLTPLAATMSRLNEQLNETGRTTGESGGMRLRSFLIVAEVALALVLLIGAGLLLRSFISLRKVDAGFRPAQVVTMRMNLPSSKYASPELLTRAYRDLEERLNQITSVKAAGFVSTIPLADDQQGTSFTFEGEPEPPSGQEHITNFALVTPRYFEAAGIPLLSGRLFVERDTPKMEKVVCASESFARRFFPGSEAVGKRIFFGWSGSEGSRIIGIVGDTRHNGLRSQPDPIVYIPYSQQVSTDPSLCLVVRTQVPPATVLNLVRQEIRRFDPGIPVYRVEPLQEIFDKALAQERFSTVLVTIFSVCALLLASIGIYGIVSYSAACRTREIGIRMALGANPGKVLSQIVRPGIKLGLVGVLLGIGASLGLTRLLEGLLFEVSPTDAGTFVLISGVWMLVILLSCLLPARRAAKLNPVEALRHQ